MASMKYIMNNLILNDPVSNFPCLLYIFLQESKPKYVFTTAYTMLVYILLAIIVNKLKYSTLM